MRAGSPGNVSRGWNMKPTGLTKTHGQLCNLMLSIAQYSVLFFSALHRLSAFPEPQFGNNCGLGAWRV